MEVSTPDGIVCIPNPNLFPLEDWKDDFTLWPSVTLEHVREYLISRPAIDGLPNAAHLSLDAMDLLMSGWVDKLFVLQCKGDMVFVSGKVARSQSTTKPEHNAWVCCRSTGNVLVGSCTCMAGLGRVCSHVSGILFKIVEGVKKGFTQTSCTDLPMTWYNSTRRHVSPQKIKHIKKRKYITGEGSKGLSPTKKFQQFYDHSEMCKHLKSSIYADLCMLKGTMWSDVLNAPNKGSEKPKKQEMKHEDHGNFGVNEEVKYIPKCPQCKGFFEKYVKLTPKKISDLQQQTVQQSASELWLDSRKVRITGSSASKCPKKILTDGKKFLKSHVFNSFKGNKSTEHGLKHETEAIRNFESTFDLEVQKSGTVVSEDDVWLSASPDGLIGIDSILEVKCPTKDIQELIFSKKYDVRREKDGTLYLAPTGKNGYYMQVQLTMHCTKRHTCYFYVWGQPYPEMIVVPYDAEFVHKHLKRLRSFYFTCMLPYLCQEFENGKLLFGRKLLSLLK